MPAEHRFDPRPFLAPRFWPSWCGFALLWLVSRLPFRLQLGLGTLLGWLLFALLPSRRRVARINLRIAFPELDATARARLLRRHYQSLGIGILELGMAWWRDDAWLLRHCRIEGLEHLEAARAQGRGVILLFPHFTTLEITGHALACRTGLSALFGESKNPLFRAMLDHLRLKRFDETVSSRDVRRCVRLLRAGRVLCYLPDQAARAARGGVLAPYFGREVLTTPGTSRLAGMSKALVIPMFPRRLEGGRGYVVVCQPPLADFPGENAVADTQRINAVFEAQIRQVPEQYLWVHERFKRGAPGAPNPYA